MKMYLMRRNCHLEPANPYAQELLLKIPERKMVECEVKQSRNVRHNALYWSLLARICDYLGQADVTPDVLHDFMKLEAGIYNQIRMPNGEIRKIPGSTSFRAADQVAFSEYFEKVIQITCERLHIPPEVIADLLTPGLVSQPELQGAA